MLSPASSLLISKSALRANFNTILKNADKAWVYPVLKADGYGLGAPEVARVFVNDAHGFFVASESEGIKLRESSVINKPIIVLNGPTRGNELFYDEFDLTPVLNGYEQAKLWLSSALASGNPRLASRRVVLQFETGMNRLGLNVTDLDLLDFSDLNVWLVMSHLACADEDENPYNQKQLAEFKRLAARFPLAKKSLAASAGTMLGKEYTFDIVRPGIGLYGGAPSPKSASAFKPVVKLRARVLRIVNLKKGEGVGYNLTWQAEQKTRVATVALGYADGFFRQAGASWQARAYGASLPVLGRVSMDLVTLDCSRVSDLKVGDWVHFLDEEQTVNDFAKHAGTIPHEVLTSIDKRVLRQWAN